MVVSGATALAGGRRRSASAADFTVVPDSIAGACDEATGFSGDGDDGDTGDIGDIGDGVLCVLDSGDNGWTGASLGGSACL